jgi:hypothetical protein
MDKNHGKVVVAVYEKGFHVIFSHFSRLTANFITFLGISYSPENEENQFLRGSNKICGTRFL